VHPAITTVKLLRESVQIAIEIAIGIEFCIRKVMGIFIAEKKVTVQLTTRRFLCHFDSDFDSDFESSFRKKNLFNKFTCI
jgi:hypothetical protein